MLACDTLERHLFSVLGAVRVLVLSRGGLPRLAMDILGEMLPWEVEGQDTPDILDGATVGMFDAGTGANPWTSSAFTQGCWPSDKSYASYGGRGDGSLSEESAAAGEAATVHRGPPEDNSEVRFDTDKGSREGAVLTRPPTSAPPEFLDAPVPATAAHVRAQRLPVATRKASKKPRAKQGASSPIKRSRPSRIWVCQEPGCTYTSGRKGAEQSAHLAPSCWLHRCTLSSRWLSKTPAKPHGLAPTRCARLTPTPDCRQL